MLSAHLGNTYSRLPLLAAIAASTIKMGTSVTATSAQMASTGTTKSARKIRRVMRQAIQPKSNTANRANIISCPTIVSLRNLSSITNALIGA